MERALPQNIEAECGVLGSMIIDPAVISLVAQILRPEDFYRAAHRSIYEAILALYHRHEPADFIMICDELRRQPSSDPHWEHRLEEAGDDSYITSLINQVPTSGNAEYYAHIVERTSNLRQLIHAAGQIAALAYEEGDDKVALSRAQGILRAIGNQGSANDIYDIDEVLDAYMIELEYLSQNCHGEITITGVPTGFNDFDVATGGLQRGDFIVLAARPGVGKTAMLINFARQVAHFAGGVGYKGLMFSAEMAKEKVGRRWLAQDSQVSQSKMRIARLDEREWQAIVTGRDLTDPGKLWICDTPRISIDALCDKARRHYDEYGVDVVYVDYLQFLQAFNERGKAFDLRRDAVGDITNKLKGLARELNVPVVCLAQLNREVEKRQSRVPIMSDLGDSSEIERTADIIGFLYEEEPNAVATPASPGYVINLLLAKYRDGERFTPLKFLYNGAQTLFTEIPQPVTTQQGTPWPEGSYSDPSIENDEDE